MLDRSSKVSHAARPHASNRTAKGIATNQRKMRIGMSIRGHGYHPDVPADGTLQVEHYVRSANKPLARITRCGRGMRPRTHTVSKK
jgi:hypothetical protein